MRFQVRFNPDQIITLMEMGEEFTERALHMGPALRQTTEIFLADQEARFASHSGWAPLTPLTILEKQEKGFPEMMVKTGQLKASLTHRVGTALSSTTSNDTRAIYGTKQPHAHLQALGTKERVQKTTGRRTGKVTPRTMGWISKSMAAAFYFTLEDYLATGKVSKSLGPGFLKGLGI